MTDDYLGASDDGTGGRPPTWLLLAAAVSVGIAALLIPVDSLATRMAGYVASTILTIGFVARFRQRDLELRAGDSYVFVANGNLVGALLIVSGLLVAIPHIWSIAVHVGKALQ